jgi:hypothetical protein
MTAVLKKHRSVTTCIMMGTSAITLWLDRINNAFFCRVDHPEQNIICSICELRAR